MSHDIIFDLIKGSSLREILEELADLKSLIPAQTLVNTGELVLGEMNNFEKRCWTLLNKKIEAYRELQLLIENLPSDLLPITLAQAVRCRSSLNITIEMLRALFLSNINKRFPYADVVAFRYPFIIVEIYYDPSEEDNSIENNHQSGNHNIDHGLNRIFLN